MSQNNFTSYEKQQSEFSYLFNEKNLSDFEESITKACQVVTEALRSKQKPFTGTNVKSLAKLFNEIDLETPKSNFDEAIEELKKLYLDDAVYFHHPRYIAHLNCPITYPAIAAELILSSINSSLDTWDQSAGGTLIEQRMIDWTVQQLGLGEQADGVFTSGGTQSNLMAMLFARDHVCNRFHRESDIKHLGLPHNYQRYRIFTSEVSHFSIQKSAAILGLGYQSVIPVPVNDALQMQPEALESLIKKTLQKGEIPVAIVATAGTTDFGSIDPLKKISEISKKYNCWMHTDAAYGCGLLLSENLKPKLSGIELSDSVTVDYHKSFFQPVSCGAFFTRNKKHLGVVTHHAAYLNPLSETLAGTPNLVNKSIQTTRRFDALKLWMTLRVIGQKELGRYFEEIVHRARQVYEILESDSEIDVINKPQISALVFRYVNHNISEKKLCECNRAIRKSLFNSGEAIIAGTDINKAAYLKFTLLNPKTTIEDIKIVIEKIKYFGNKFIQENELL